MKIDTLKDLEKLVKLCRRMGIEAIELDGIKMNLGPQPKTIRKSRTVENDIPEANIKIPQYKPIVTESVAEYVADVIKTDELTDEQLMFYSAAESN